MIERRRLIKTVATAGTAMIAGCSTNTGDGDENDEDTGDSGNNGSSLAESGRVSAGDHTQKIEVEEGETIRVEADNEEGEATLVSLGDPEGEQIFSNFVETEDTFTHTTEQTGVFTVLYRSPTEQRPIRYTLSKSTPDCGDPTQRVVTDELLGLTRGMCLNP